MGWHRIAKDLDTEESWCDKDEPPSLWTRGGLEGVCVSVSGVCVHIPRSSLEAMAAKEIQRARMTRIESMTLEDVWHEVLGE
jgi:hypothetical protein